MEPGRELDELVAEKVMGLTPIKIDKDKAIELLNIPSKLPAAYRVEIVAQQLAGIWVDENKLIIKGEDLPAYSTDIAAAWKVVHKLQSEKWVFRLESPFYNLIPGYWTAYFGWKYVGDAEFTNVCNESYCQTPPHAICLAALKAAGVEL